MIHEAINTVEVVVWGAIVSFALLTALGAYLVLAAAYWLFAAARWATRWATTHIRHRRHVTEHRQQLLLEQQQMARLRDAIDQAPLIPTQPGQDDDLLNACWNAWKADTTRKEKP